MPSTSKLLIHAQSHKLQRKRMAYFCPIFPTFCAARRRRVGGCWLTVGACGATLVSSNTAGALQVQCNEERKKQKK
jgi:hypothetical protein